jgi:hypothetical protein
MLRCIRTAHQWRDDDSRRRYVIPAGQSCVPAHSTFVYFFLFDKEWEFVQGLAYKEQTPEDADFVQLIYTARLRKYKHAEEHALTRRRLADEFGLSDNPDVLFSFADALYAQFRWADCFIITSRYAVTCLCSFQNQCDGYLLL